MYLLYDVDKKESQTTGMLVNDYVSDENYVPMDTSARRLLFWALLFK